MKEQVSVSVHADVTTALMLYGNVELSMVPTEEYERLTRLDRHLRIKISEFIAKSRDYPMTATNNRYDDIVKSLQEILE